MAASLLVTMMTTRRCAPRHGSTARHGKDFGNNMAMFDRDHWQCMETIVNHNDSMVDGPKLGTRDDSGHVMGCVVHVENKHCENKECLDDLFDQLSMPREKHAQGE